GLGRRLPLTMAALVAGGLGLIGVPGTAGFVSKWYLVLAAIDAGQMGIAAAILLSSLLAVVYVWRLIEVAYFQEPADGNAGAGGGAERPALLVPAWGLTLASLFFGVFTELPVGLAGLAATQLVEGSEVATVSGERPAHHDEAHDAQAPHHDPGAPPTPASPPNPNHADPSSAA